MSTATITSTSANAGTSHGGHKLPMAIIVAGEDGAPHTVYVADHERVPCPHESCACDFKNVGSLRNHILHQHNAEPKLVSVKPDHHMYKFRPSENEQQAGPEIAPREAVGVHRVLAGSTGNKDEEIQDDDPEISRELMVGMASIEQLRAFLSCCRVTPNHRFSVLDAIMKVTGCSYDAARQAWHRILQCDAAKIFETHQFPGERQRKTPVATIPNLLRIFSDLPGKIGAYIRTRNVKLAARADAGDSDLRDAIHRRGENISASDQEVLMGDLPSTEQAQQAREERKQQENGAPRLECNIEELREIAEAMSPAMEFTDVQLKLNWEISKSDRIEFVTQMMSFIKKFFETAEAAAKYQKAQHETSAAEQVAKEAEEKRKAAEEKRKAAEEKRKAAEEQREQQRQASDEQRQQQLKASEEQHEQQRQASDEQRQQQLKASDEQRELQRKAADEEREIRLKAAELQETNTNELFQSSKRRSMDQEAEASAKRRKAELEVTTAASQPEREKKTEKRKEKGTTKRHKLTETEITTREKNALDAKIELEKIALQKSMIEKARKDKTIREIAKIFANKTSECGEEEVEEAAENKDEEQKKEEPAPPPKKTVRVSGSGRPGFSQTMGDTTFTNEKEEEKEEQDDVVMSESEHSDSRNDIKEDEEEEEEDDDDHDSDSDFVPSDAEELELALETPRSVKHIQARLTSWIEYTKLHARFAVASNAHVVVKNSTVPRKELDQLTGVKLLDYNQSHIPYKKFGLEGPSAELNPFKPLEFFLAIKPTETGLKLSSFARNLCS